MSPLHYLDRLLEPILFIKHRIDRTRSPIVVRTREDKTRDVVMFIPKSEFRLCPDQDKKFVTMCYYILDMTLFSLKLLRYAFQTCSFLSNEIDSALARLLPAWFT